MLSRTKKPIDFWPNACVCKVCFVRFIQRFIIKPPGRPHLVIQLTLGMAAAIRCDSGIGSHHCTVWVAFSKWDLSPELVVAAALRYSVVILLSILSKTDFLLVVALNT